MLALSLATPVLMTFVGVYALLIGVTGLAWWLRQKYPDRNYREIVQRIHSWWWIVVVFTVALLLSHTTAVVFFALISFLALKEYLSLVPVRRSDRRVLFWAYLTIPFQYYWVAAGWYGMFIIFIPVYAFLFMPIRMISIGDTRDFLRAAGTIHWGLMTTVFSISHVAFLLALPEEGNPGIGGAGLVLFLVLLTALNDVAQFAWGKTLGRRQVTPKISPNKTVEGFLGGVVTISLLAILLAPVLTPMNWYHALLAGMIISVGGFIGDATISALKRDIGVKDSGNSIPGHGGILDRVDSLTYTAPLFFHFIYYFYY